jgi:hypothetical protein
VLEDLLCGSSMMVRPFILPLIVAKGGRKAKNGWTFLIPVSDTQAYRQFGSRACMGSHYDFGT